MAELSVAVVGCGRMGGVHTAAWARLSGARIAAVCDRDGPTVARLAARVPGAAAFTQARDLLSAGPFDIVDVCVPAEEQFAVADAALRAGANVVCETPFTASPSDAARLVQTAAERERLLMPAFCFRFHPLVLFLQERLENDDMGRPTMFRCRFAGAVTADPTEAAESGKGALMTTALHGVDLFRYLIGEVATLTAATARFTPGLNVEDTAGLLLRAENGAIGTVEVSWTEPGARNLVEVYGTAGGCQADFDAGVVHFVTADQPIRQTREESGPDRFERELAHFADAVRGLQPLVVAGADGASAVALCAQAAGQGDEPA